MFKSIETEINSFSKTFRILFFTLFAVYLCFWLYTIYLANFQLAHNLSPVLPVLPQDSTEYKALAESIISLHQFSQNGRLDTLRAPGYPGFVAILIFIFKSYFAVSLLQILLAFSSAVIIRRLGALFHSQRAGEIAAVLFLINPLILTLSLVVLTDLLFMFLFLLGFYLCLTLDYDNLIKRTVLASIFFALAIYTRPMGVFALPIFFAPILTSNTFPLQKIKSLVVMILVLLVAVSPWVYRNYRNTGVADFTSFKAINLAGFAVPAYLANLHHTNIDVERANMEKYIGLTRAQWEDLHYSNQVSAAAEKIILEHPFSYLKYHIVSSIPFLFPSDLQDVLTTYRGALHIETPYEPGAINYLTSRDWKLFLASISEVWWKIAERIVWLLIYIIALFGLWQNRKKPLTWALIFVPAYLMLLSGPSANARYAAQDLPYVLILFATGFVQIQNKFRKKDV